MIQNPKHIVISRTDSIGDVALTLPLVGILKKKFPNTKISFLGNTYTKPVIESCEHVDEIWEWAELQKLNQQEQINFLKSKKIDVFIHVFPRKEIAKLAKKAKITHRIGTSHRFFHLLTCTHRPGFTRKNSDLHEAQLNTKLLSPLGITKDYSLPELAHLAAFKNIHPLPSELQNLLSPEKKNIILHPKSQGSAREWALENYIEIAAELDPAKYNIFFTGTEKEGLLFRNFIPKKPNVFDLTGKMNLYELIAFIKAADALIAASTGPLHLAGLTGIYAFGLFATQRPTHAGRWQPLGNKVYILEEKIISNPTQPLNIPLRDAMQALEQRV
ncbi:MAG: glycosyltransferase family 9 protein [Crocinitomicaceae bacterium]|nr:glycosyltransferase family 9 protein [Crocinitomicaceae bacterium]